jgi:hypothetical protein
MMMKSFGGRVPALPENWKELTPAQKRQWRLDCFANTEGIDFISPETRQNFITRTKRIVDFYNLTEPDRVPLNLPAGNLPYMLSCINLRTAMYDYNQAVEACKSFNEKYSAELEYFASPSITPGRIMDLLDYKLYVWPGHGLPGEAVGVQFVEREYMKAEEYDDLIRDPSDFCFATIFRGFSFF